MCKRHVPLAKLLPYMKKRIYIISSNLAIAPCMTPTHTKQLHVLHMCLCLACNCVYFANMYGCRCTLNGVTFTYLQQKYEPRCTLNRVTFTYLQQKYTPLILDNVVRA